MFGSKFWWSYFIVVGHQSGVLLIQFCHLDQKWLMGMINRKMRASKVSN